MTVRLLITYFEIASLRCSERDIIPASVYNLLVFVCTGTPMANLIALLSILCSFFRSVFGACRTGKIKAFNQRPFSFSGGRKCRFT